MGAAPVKNSGRGLQKGDGTWGEFLVDVKEYSKSFSISRAVWAKISTDAVKNGNRQPLLALVLGEPGVPPLRVFVVGESMFHDMKQAWEEKNEIQN